MWWLRLSGWVLLVMAVLFAVLAKGAHDDALRLRDEGVEAVATVAAVDSFGRDSGIVAEFTSPTGELVEVELGLPEPPPGVGDEIRVLYVPNDPWLVEFAGDGPDFGWPWFLAALAALWLIVAAFSFAGWINWRRVLGVSPYDVDSR